jgi:hypothetical protein
MIIKKGKNGYIQIEAFFQIIELHDILLRPEDKIILKKLCETRSS